MKILPNNLEAEQSILGACMIDTNSVIQAVEILVPEDFYREDNKIIFSCIHSLFSKNQPIDIITLKEEIASIGKLEQIGGLEYIATLPEKIPTTANIEMYIKIVKDKAISRNLIEMSNEISKLGFDSTITTEQLTDIAEKKVFEITQKKNTKNASRFKDVISSCINNLEEVVKNGKKKGIPTGFIDLDKKMGGLKPTELIILAARPAMGKSAFALNIAIHVAKNEKVPVLIFNLEMGKEQLVDRIICSECFIDSVKYREGNIQDEDWTKLANGLSTLTESNIFIDDTSSLTISEIKAKCRKMKIEENIGLVIIDYLQLISPSGNKTSREQEVAEISRSLKILAKDLKIPIIALSQLSRANEKRNSQDKRPMLSDLRDSGSIEQDADIVMFIHREDYYNKDIVEPDKKNIAEIILAKNRAGETGIENLLWIGEYTKFVNICKRDNV